MRTKVIKWILLYKKRARERERVHCITATFRTKKEKKLDMGGIQFTTPLLRSTHNIYYVLSSCCAQSDCMRMTNDSLNVCNLVKCLWKLPGAEPGKRFHEAVWVRFVGACYCKTHYYTQCQIMEPAPLKIRLHILVSLKSNTHTMCILMLGSVTFVLANVHHRGYF